MSAKHVDLFRPGPSGGATYGPIYARIDLNDVRAANTLLVHFDFERDGWVLESPIPAADDPWGEELEEVGFVPAWTERAGAAVDERPRVRGKGANSMTSDEPNTVDIPCPNCGHSHRMHRKLDGCMTVVNQHVHGNRRGRYCTCPYKPDAIRTVALAERGA